jgi:hypothetical protein
MRTCELCGSPCRKKYCSNKCNNAASKRRRAAVLHQCTCDDCGSAFEATRPGRMYCESCARHHANGRSWSRRTCQHCGELYETAGDYTKHCRACEVILARQWQAKYSDADLDAYDLADLADQADEGSGHECVACAAIELCRRRVWQHVTLPCTIPGATRRGIARAVANGTIEEMYRPIKFELRSTTT